MGQQPTKTVEDVRIQLLANMATKDVTSREYGKGKRECRICGMSGSDRHEAQTSEQCQNIFEIQAVIGFGAACSLGEERVPGLKVRTTRRFCFEAE